MSQVTRIQLLSDRYASIHDALDTELEGDLEILSAEIMALMHRLLAVLSVQRCRRSPLTLVIREA